MIHAQPSAVGRVLTIDPDVRPLGKQFPVAIETGGEAEETGFDPPP
jgi:hypothetical protein